VTATMLRSLLQTGAAPQRMSPSTKTRRR